MKKTSFIGRLKPFNMKLLFLLLLFSHYSHGQIPPKKASKIIVLANDSSNILLKKITLALFDRGYTIDTKDDNLKYVTTKERASKKYNTLFKIRVGINDTAIIFTGTMALAFETQFLGVKQPPTFQPIVYQGMKKSPVMDAWNELDAIARMFGDKITYSK